MKPTFDPNISLGNLLQIATLLIASAVFIMGIDNHITVVDLKNKAEHIRIESQSKARDQELSNSLERTADAVARLEQQVSKYGPIGSSD